MWISVCVATFLTAYSIAASNGCSPKQPTAHQTANVKFHFDLRQKSNPSWSARFVLLSARPFAPMSMAHWLPHCIPAWDAAHSYLGDSPPTSPPHPFACWGRTWCQEILNEFCPPWSKQNSFYTGLFVHWNYSINEGKNLPCISQKWQWRTLLVP